MKNKMSMLCFLAIAGIASSVAAIEKPEGKEKAAKTYEIKSIANQMANFCHHLQSVFL